MTTQSSKPSRSKRIVYTVIGITTIIALFIGLRIYNRVQSRAAIQPKVIAAIHADFPDFCKDGQILAEPNAFPYSTALLFADHDSQWGIKCDTWAKVGLYYGEATILDVDHCTTIHPIVSTLGEYYNDYEAINKSNGQQLAVCP